MEENLNIFGKNQGEIGSLDKNLVLRTKGRVYIRYGRKYIDLLDSQGNLNVKVPKVLSKITSKDQIKSNGFYLLDGNLYAYVDGETFQITGTEGSFLSYAIEQNLDSDQINTAQKNIGLKYNSIDEASKSVKDGIVFIGSEMYYINNGSYTKIGLQGPLESINNAGLSVVPSSNNQYIAYVNGQWTYVPINGEASGEVFSSLEYSEQDKEINFFNSNGDIVATLDVTNFLKDGMIESATISDNNLIISFNDDASKEDIVVSLADIFDPTKYYTKTEVDNIVATATNDMATKTWTNAQGFLKQHQSLENYYTKSQTYSKTEVDNLQYWKRNGTTLSPKNDGDNIDTTGVMYHSDIRLKENVKQISENDIKDIDKIKFYHYNFIQGDKKPKSGVIAQELIKAGFDKYVDSSNPEQLSVDIISILCDKIAYLENELKNLKNGNL